MFLRQCWDFN